MTELTFFEQKKQIINERKKKNYRLKMELDRKKNKQARRAHKKALEQLHDSALRKLSFFKPQRQATQLAPLHAAPAANEVQFTKMLKGYGGC